MIVVASRTNPKFFRTQAAQPKGPKPFARKKALEKAIQHAEMICANFEDTAECRVAWGVVEEMSAAEADIKRRQKEILDLVKEDEWWEELSEREYDM
jgi:CRISPR/Cas system-associated protein Csm6